MLFRVLEPEAVETPEEAADYDAMDHEAVNARFVADFRAVHGPARGGEMLDVGTGPARIALALCRADPLARLLGIDMAPAMLDLARAKVDAAGLGDRIRLAQADAKALPDADRTFEAVISNTIIHHIPDPSKALAEMVRVLAPGGTLFVRDLARPSDESELARLVETHAGRERDAARAMFAASLRAGLTLEEVRAEVRALGLPAEGVAMTSDRHWTWVWRCPD